MVDIYQALSAVGASVKPGLQLWLRNKMVDAAISLDWDKFDRYFTFYDCLTFKDCDDLKEIKRKEG